MLKICTHEWEFFGRERSVWSVLGFVFDKKCVRVISKREVGKVSKMKP